ncbi:MAG TPA: RNA 2'-phosphotransferase [Thermoplasmatales archaeon]|nr:RNA 2'-phosphotransferase [Candidatus Thermoplasmatota archaeon]HDS59967.1 RNA 2'-phosphotransferase [Thermoplasmatales archaeon]
MLAVCEDHGPYRGPECPVCGEKGKFLMSDREIRALSGTMAGILRHFPEQFRVDMDEHGWVGIEDLVHAIKDNRLNFHWLRDKHVEAIAGTDEKGRYQVKGGKVRATYAHTFPVDLTDLPESDADELFYPVTQEEADLVVETGLYPTDRSKVHLSESREKALEAGRVRTQHPVILRIDAAQAREDGVDIRRAGKDVCITDEVEAKYISLLE